MSEKCHNNNNFDNPLTSRRTDAGKNDNVIRKTTTTLTIP